MFKYKKSSNEIFCMSTLRGKYVRVEKDVPFSFYYSRKRSSHGPRVKVVFNKDKMREDVAGTLKLCDNWEFTPGKNDKNVSQKEIRKMKDFFRRYLILFLLVWENYSDEPDPQDYFQENQTLHELITNIDFYPEYQDEMNRIETVAELETFCRENNLVNMYGN